MATTKKNDNTPAKKAKTAIDRAYATGPDENAIKLTIVFGDAGQSATTIMSLDGKVIKDAGGSDVHSGDVSVELGKSKSLDGKELNISATILVLSPSSLHTEMLISLTGGTSNKDFLLQKDAAKKGEHINYSADFRFKKQ
jgi:hypothetical protein